MKIEVRCESCGKGHLLDEAKIPSTGGRFACQGCGEPVRLGVPPTEAGKPDARPDPPGRTRRPPAKEVVCPRCRLHFVPSEAKAAAAARSRPTVLLVEDMEYFREIAREALASRYEVRIAGSVREARDVLAGGGIDLLLLDLTLQSEEDGLELLRSFPVKPCPVLLFTAQDESEIYGESWQRLRDLGADDIVIKGMNVGESLLRKAGALLGEPVEEDLRP